jgi:hypothetical protein
MMGDVVFTSARPGRIPRGEPLLNSRVVACMMYQRWYCTLQTFLTAVLVLSTNVGMYSTNVGSFNLMKWWTVTMQSR